MTHPFATRQIPFFLTASAPCPYLPGRFERKVFTRVEIGEGPALNDALTHAGFRRSQGVLYRPACEACDACKSVRVDAESFEWKRRWRKILNRNDELRVSVETQTATMEQFDLLSRYLDSRHGDGDMAGMSFGEYVMMVEEGAQRTHVAEYRDADGVLRAAALTDVLKDGLSLIYSYFDPDWDRRSLGAYIILDAIRQAELAGLPFVYLGYWVRESPKMSYKAQFQPLQVLTPSGWQLHAELANHEDEDEHDGFD
ncbi:arginyltransferase [uncultured Maricaulis sp.]|uniref:arginyltransferase n=1 Tax=uncultured Maricaulis sp. TaxID=174710 RepID=UPI0025E9C627|nr:arginyltransferase [uncultured Maricaulis sp.]